MAIPVIDFGGFDGSEDRRARVIEEVGDACRNWGFFQVVDHGIADELIDRVWSETRAFFELPRDVKLAISRTAENPRGYYDRELTKNARDQKEVFDFGYVLRPDLADDHPANRAPVDGFNQWPAAAPELRSTMTAYFAACEGLGARIFQAFSLGLGLEADHLESYFQPHTSFVRLNYYPLTDPLAAAEAAEVTELGEMALGHHTDSGALTILLQDDVGGLQVHDGADWIDVPPTEGAFVINIGDMTQVWSNDRYRAALHRVRPMKRAARYSLPFFYNPSYETDCAPLPTPDAAAPRYRPINWGEFRAARTAGDYADYGEEIQIEHFRIEE
ncbi:MAG: isopenicillin N synthase family oxygenase [Gemmatimonadota bacterium]|nr:isopenicillin N synthase family oxygenase [Gemmatimonadota bacterium]